MHEVRTLTAERDRPALAPEAAGSAPGPNKTLVVLAGIVLIGLIGVLDTLTGYELAFSLFYLLPIAFVTWHAGKRAGIALSVLSGAAWTVADAGAGHIYSQPFILYWNALLRFGFFLTVTLLLAALRESLEHERQLARLDFLTGAVNGRHFVEMIRAEVERAGRYGRPFTLVYFDVDNFKQVNDRFGHNAGDAVLRAVVAAARARLRASDTVARLGGDEFGALLPETDPDAARVAVTNMHASLRQRVSGEGWPVTFSIGALTCFGAGFAPDALLKAADELMYRVKKTGKDNVIFEVAESPRPAQPREAEAPGAPVPGASTPDAPRAPR
jgi:diguanylate cyclase (GGDEF)-like protein